MVTSEDMELISDAVLEAIRPFRGTPNTHETRLRIARAVSRALGVEVYPQAFPDLLDHHNWTPALRSLTPLEPGGVQPRYFNYKGEEITVIGYRWETDEEYRKRLLVRLS